MKPYQLPHLVGFTSLFYFNIASFICFVIDIFSLNLYDNYKNSTRSIFSYILLKSKNCIKSSSVADNQTLLA